jgi:hypothetical protein
VLLAVLLAAAVLLAVWSSCPEGEGAPDAAPRGMAGAMTTRAATRLVAVGCLLIALERQECIRSRESGAPTPLCPGVWSF